MSSTAVDKLGVVGKISKLVNVSLQQTFNGIPLRKSRYRGSFPSDNNPTPDKDTFAIVITQPSNIKGEHWIMIASSLQILFFADSLGRKKHSLLEQQSKQMVPK